MDYSLKRFLSLRQHLFKGIGTSLFKEVFLWKNIFMRADVFFFSNELGIDG